MRHSERPTEVWHPLEDPYNAQEYGRVVQLLERSLAPDIGDTPVSKIHSDPWLLEYLAVEVALLSVADVLEHEVEYLLEEGHILPAPITPGRKLVDDVPFIPIPAYAWALNLLCDPRIGRGDITPYRWLSLCREKHANVLRVSDMAVEAWSSVTGAGVGFADHDYDLPRFPRDDRDSRELRLWHMLSRRLRPRREERHMAPGVYIEIDHPSRICDTFRVVRPLLPEDNPRSCGCPQCDQMAPSSGVSRIDQSVSPVWASDMCDACMEAGCVPGTLAAWLPGGILRKNQKQYKARHKTSAPKTA